MLNKNLNYLLFFVLLYFSQSYAGMDKLDYVLPEESINWIENVFILEKTILVIHQSGISVSTDGGASFREAAINSKFRHHYRTQLDTGFISHDKSTFLISTGYNHFISCNNGISFEKIEQSPKNGFKKVLEDGINLYCLTNYYHNETLHCEYFFISKDHGKTWNKTTVGSNNSENVHDIFLENHILYALTDDLWPTDDERKKLYCSHDHGNTYIRTPYESGSPMFERSEQDTSLFLQRWREMDLDMPEMVVNEAQGNYYFTYANREFNRLKPAQGIFYERPSGKTLNANIAPRKGGFTSNAREKIYYVSFKDIWIER
jgi:hypothetical protein